MGTFDRFERPGGSSAGTVIADAIKTFSGDIYDVKSLFDYLRSVKENLPTTDLMSSLAKIEDNVLKNMDGDSVFNIGSFKEDTQEMMNIFQDGKTLKYKDENGALQEIVIDNMTYVGVHDEHMVIKNTDNEIIFDINGTLERVTTLEGQISNLVENTDTALFYEEQKDENDETTGYELKDVDGNTLISTVNIYEKIDTNKTNIDSNKTNIDTNTSNISDLSDKIDSNKTNIDTNTSNISDLSNEVSEKLTTNGEKKDIIIGDETILNVENIVKIKTKDDDDNDVKILMDGETEIVDLEKLSGSSVDGLGFISLNDTKDSDDKNYIVNGTSEYKVVYRDNSDDDNTVNGHYELVHKFGIDIFKDLDTTDNDNVGTVILEPKGDFKIPNIVPMVTVVDGHNFISLSYERPDGILSKITFNMFDKDDADVNATFFLSIRVL